MKQSIGAQTILFPTPVLAVGTYDPNDRPNAAIVAWGGICCSKPPAVAISLRKATYTHGNIVARQAFTLSIPSEKYAKEADFMGIYSGRDLDKFEALGLTPVRSDVVDAPYIEEFPLILECRVIHTLEIGLHTQFVGEILDLKVEKSALTAKGHPAIEKISPFVFAPGERAYYRIGQKIGDAFKIGKKEA